MSVGDLAELSTPRALFGAGTRSMRLVFGFVYKFALSGHSFHGIWSCYFALEIFTSEFKLLHPFVNSSLLIIELLPSNAKTAQFLSNARTRTGLKYGGSSILCALIMSDEKANLLKFFCESYSSSPTYTLNQTSPLTLRRPTLLSNA